MFKEEQQWVYKGASLHVIKRGYLHNVIGAVEMTHTCTKIIAPSIDEHLYVHSKKPYMYKDNSSVH